MQFSLNFIIIIYEQIEEVKMVDLVGKRVNWATFERDLYRTAALG